MVYVSLPCCVLLFVEFLQLLLKTSLVSVFLLLPMLMLVRSCLLSFTHSMRYTAAEIYGSVSPVWSYKVDFAVDLAHTMYDQGDPQNGFHAACSRINPAGFQGAVLLVGCCRVVLCFCACAD